MEVRLVGIFNRPFMALVDFIAPQFKFYINHRSGFLFWTFCLLLRSYHHLKNLADVLSQKQC